MTQNISLLVAIRTGEFHPPMLARAISTLDHVLGGRLTITLLDGIGHGVEVHEMHTATVVAAIHELEERAQRKVQARVVSLFQR